MRIEMKAQTSNPSVLGSTIRRLPRIMPELSSFLIRWCMAALARYLQKGRAGVLYQELQYLAVDLVDRPVLVVVHFGEALRFQYTKFLADLDEGLDATVELLDAMACRYLYAYARLTLRHNRIVESRDEDALLLQACGEVLR